MNEVKGKLGSSCSFFLSLSLSLSLFTMAQKTLKKSIKAFAKKQSAGAARKKLGHTAKNMRTKVNVLRDKLQSSFSNAIEQQLASRVPSDQRDRLTVLRDAQRNGHLTAGTTNPLKHKKKQLTRGRRRKSERAKGEK